jgi:hypothetical protein
VAPPLAVVVFAALVEGQHLRRHVVPAKALVT